jgi:hypothetical protein
VALPPGNGATAGTFLVDGMWQGTWQIRDQTLRIQPFIKLRSADRDALLTGWPARLASSWRWACAGMILLEDRQPAAGYEDARHCRIEGVTRTHVHASLDIFQSRLDCCK